MEEDGNSKLPDDYTNRVLTDMLLEMVKVRAATGVLIVTFAVHAHALLPQSVQVRFQAANGKRPARIVRLHHFKVQSQSKLYGEGQGTHEMCSIHACRSAY